jgi:diguanylate cyclase (GGDEF)-like protein/PAS domain S-box-containing protein
MEHRVRDHESPLVGTAAQEMQHWRETMFNTATRVVFFSMLPAWVLACAMSFAFQTFWWLAFTTAQILLIGVAAFVHRLGFSRRVWLLLGIIFVAGTVWLLESSLPGVGHIHYIMLIVLAALLLPRRDAVLVWLACLFTIGGIYSGFLLQWLPLPTAILERLFSPYTLGVSWFALVTVSGVIGWAIILSIRGGQQSLQRGYAARIELQRINAELEQRVAQRTAELSYANTHLKQEIAERERIAAELRTSEEQYRLLVEHSNDGIVVLVDGHITYSNDRITAMLGYPLDEVVGQSMLRFVVPEDRERVMAMHQQRLRGTHVPAHYEVGLLHRDGHAMHVEVSAGRIVQGDQPKVLAFVRDITARKQVENVLRASEERLRQILDSNPDGMLVLNEQREVLYANPRARTLLEYEYLRGQTFDYTLAIGESIEVDVVRQSGSVVVVEILAIETDWAGQRAYVVSMRDVTERNSLEEELWAARERLHHLMTSSPAMIYSRRASEGYEITFLSENVIRVLGYNAHNFLNDPDFWTSRLHPDDAPAVLTNRHHVFDDGASSHEYRFLMADGSYRWLHDQCKLVYDAEGYPLEIVGSWQDITERKRAEAALRHRVQELDALRATMTEMSSELELDRLLRSILERAVALLGASDGELSMYEEARGALFVRVSYNMPFDNTGKRVEWGEGATGHVAHTGQPLIIDDYLAWEGRVPDYEDLGKKSVILVPLLAGLQVLGVIGVGDAKLRRSFDEEDVELLTLFAQQATIAIQNARLFTEVQQLATTDPLTGLYNRRHFFVLAQREFERTLRYSHALSVVMLDVDNFKRVNDTYGHAAGDQVLRHVSDLCRSALRSVDVLGRYGGEEVVMVLPETSINGAQQVAERLRRSLSHTACAINGLLLPITASLGVATYDSSDPIDLEALIDRADQALYAAKQRGKNRVVLWSAEIAWDRSQAEPPTEDLRVRSQHAEALVRVAAHLNAHMHDLDVVLKTVCEETSRTLEVPVAGIQLYDEQHDTLTIAALSGLPSSYAEQARPVPRRVYEAVAREQEQVIMFADVQAVPDLPNADLHRSLDVRTLVSVPMRRAGELVGALNIGTFSEVRSFSSEEIALLQGLADQAALAIANARLFSDLAHAYDATLEGWSRAVEIRDHETQAHTRRVADYTVRLAQWMGIDGPELMHIRRGALLHDIGKLGVPDMILHKPGPLSDDEWTLMRQHPLYAYELLEPIRFLRPALAIPHSHHEWWDGSGYPRGLQGEQIPLAARIFAVVDVWDALRSDRPYRAAWSDEQVCAYLREQAGIQFDPQVVAAFLALCAEECTACQMGE